MRAETTNPIADPSEIFGHLMLSIFQQRIARLAEMLNGCRVGLTRVEQCNRIAIGSILACGFGAHADESCTVVNERVSHQWMNTWGSSSHRAEHRRWREKEREMLVEATVDPPITLAYQLAASQAAAIQNKLIAAGSAGL